jgi:hypothetical protein
MLLLYLVPKPNFTHGQKDLRLAIPPTPETTQQHAARNDDSTTSFAFQQWNRHLLSSCSGTISGAARASAGFPKGAQGT